jgi:hypothetical protein
VKPIFAEELLVLEKYGVDKICEFYSIPSDKEAERMKRIEELISKCKELAQRFCSL